MSATPNLAIEHILQIQAQKEVTANEAFDALDQAIAGLIEVDVSAGGTITSRCRGGARVQDAAPDRHARSRCRGRRPR